MAAILLYSMAMTNEWQVPDQEKAHSIYLVSLHFITKPFKRVFTNTKKKKRNKTPALKWTLLAPTKRICRTRDPWSHQNILRQLTGPSDGTRSEAERNSQEFGELTWVPFCFAPRLTSHLNRKQSCENMDPLELPLLVLNFRKTMDHSHRWIFDGLF